MFTAAPPRLPRSVAEPSFSQSTACGPYEIGGSMVFAHLPDAPTAWPLSLIQRATPTELPELALPRPPDHGFKIENLRTGAGECHSGWALRVPRAILRDPDHFASIVDRADRAVVASQRREHSHHAALPHGRQTFQAGAVSAEVFIIWIFRGGFRLHCGLAKLVEAKRCAVQSRCADVHLQSQSPEGGVLCTVTDGRHATY